MTTIAVVGPQGSHSCLAAEQFNQQATFSLFSDLRTAARAFQNYETDHMVIPVYNTRVGGLLKSFQLLEKLKNVFWIDNVVLPIHLSLGGLDREHGLKMLLGTGPILRQCEEYISRLYPHIPLLTVTDITEAMAEIKRDGLTDRGVLEAENVLLTNGFVIREREAAPHNKTRFAILGHRMAPRTGYDATAMITVPLKDRVGMLYDTLGEFTGRGINILDMRAENDVKTQKLQIYIEAEGHIGDPEIQAALTRIEQHVVQEEDCIRVLGSYPRVDMRVKRIKTFGFIGTGDMSTWFARKLEHEGYRTMLTGRSTKLRPEKMIEQVDVVVICVPISNTPETVEKYGLLLRDGQALILLAGEAENTLDTTLNNTAQGVEVMLVHNLWGPKAVTMKDKNACVIRTSRSGRLCSEFEAFLYKHGADICHDTPSHHDLLMGVGQKLPTTISVALAMALEQNKIKTDDIGKHSTLTSLYSILAMARIHSQNARTYAEIMSTGGDGCKIVKSFARNLLKLMDMAEEGQINELCRLIDKNSNYLSKDFLESSMKQALAVDKTLSKIIS